MPLAGYRRQHTACIVVGLRVIRPDRERPLEVRDGLFRSAQSVKRVAEINVSFCIAWLGSNRPLVMGNCRFVSAQQL